MSRALFRLWPAVAAIVLLHTGCAASTEGPELPPCYNTFPVASHACMSDWTGIDKVTAGTADQPAARSAFCKCPPHTACFRIDAELVACALTAS